MTVPNERAEPGTPDDLVLAAPSALDVLRAAAGLISDSRPDAPLPPGLLGAFGHELVDRWEDLGPRNPDPLDEPDFTFVLAFDMAVYDGASGRATAIVRGLPWERASDVAARADRLASMMRTRPHVIEPEKAEPGGVTPDFTLPVAPFFSPTADTISFVGVDSFSFTAGMFPTDGINSLTETPLGSSNFDIGLNSPTNFAGEVGFVPEPSTLLLAAIGALGLLGSHRRRRRR